ncbi:N-terminal Xaa-Pro-Lys N-methyltransferase 1 [Echinococcus granulosus]|nr:N-terminal Xaa-Pro-Lys N-methyltransferase 1 [Echinococcus granulosus]
MVEMTGKFLDASSAYIDRPNAERVGNRFCCALQDFTPPEGRYDIIWVQWVIGYLTLSATVEFLRRCVAGLRPCNSTATGTATDPVGQSVIVLKDNVFPDAKPDFDEAESSFMRTHDELLENLLSCLTVSWTPTGELVALTGTGTLSESTASAAATNSTSIVQVDHDLKVKRVIPIDALLKEHLEDLTEPRPIDILWTSSYCFLLGVTDAASAKEMRLVFITVLPKSEPRLGKLPEFTSLGGGLCRYLMCLVPNSTTLATVTWLPDAEECYLLDVPSITASNGSPPADSLPKLIKPLPLPTDSYPIAMHVGALLDSLDPLPLIIGLLANGAVFAFKILPARISQAEGSCNVFAGFRMWCGSADKPPQLPSGATTTNSATLFPATAFGSLFGKAATTGEELLLKLLQVVLLILKQVCLANVVASSTPTVATDSSVVSWFEKPATSENPTAEPSAPTQSIMEAANHFWKALRSQAETSARAWSYLQSVFEGDSLNLQQKGDEVGVRRGVWGIEQSLNNMDDFLCVVEEITTELRKASQLSANEQTASADYLDSLSADFDAFRHRISDKHRVIVAAGLDPGAAATLASLRRKSRAAESFLAELEDQVESLSAQLDARNERNNRLMSGSKLSLPMGDVGSPLDKIQATIATNARLIKCERYRLELIARMAGISLSDCGSAISVDREQKDARLYRLLCGGDRCKTKTRTGKSTGPERLPVAKAPSTVAEVVELMRKEREKEDAQPPKSTPKSAGRIPLKPSVSSSSPKAASQMTAPTMKVFGAPIGDLGVENFKPLSSRLPSPTNVPDAASTGVCAVSVSRKSPPFTSPSIPTAAQRNVVVATTTGAAVSQLGTTVSTVAAVAASSESGHMSGKYCVFLFKQLLKAVLAPL